MRKSSKSKKAKNSKTKNPCPLKTEEDTTTTTNEGDNNAKSKKRPKIINKLQELRGLIELNDDHDRESVQDEMMKKQSSTSINKTNSKILNDVFNDLSSLSSENTQTNIELSEKDKQRISQFRERQKELRSRAKDFKSFRKRFIFDFSYFKSCSFYKQLFIFILCIMTLIDSSFILSVLNKTQADEEVNVILQMIFASATILTLIVILFLYLCNLVGRFAQDSWLTCEFYIYLVFTIFYFINTIILFTFGPQFTLQGVFGIFIFLNFFGLAITKLMMAHLKITAQQRIEDPDGNFARAKQLNARFSFPKRNLLRVWTV